MTKEEIKALKVGDKFAIEYTVSEIDREDTNMPIRAKLKDGTPQWAYSMYLRNATLVKPAPKFEVGDIVRIIPDPLTGTVHKGTISKPDVDEGREYKIIGEIDAAGDCKVERNFRSAWVSVHCLELVKKALKDKYKVINLIRTFEVVTKCTNDSIGSFSVASFNIVRHPNAEAAAKAECDRLNAEWRKQQEGGEA